MIGFDPNMRRPASSVPTRRDDRIRASSQSGGSDLGQQRSNSRALVPVKPAKTEDRPALKLVSSNDTPVSDACAQAGVDLQSRLPSPRRGLRADAGERARYNRAYATASTASPQAQTPKIQVRL